AMRQACVTLAREVPNLFYLTDCGPIELTPSVALLGDDGWGDATRGDYERSPIRLRDFQHISDFCDQPKATWQTTLQSLGASSANRLAEKASRLHDEIQVVVVATHVPPFPEACWYEGHTTDELWAPFFVCGQLGDALRRMADASLKRSWIVLCGHTHHDGIANISDNLVVHTGHSTYGEVGIESIIRVGPGHVEVPRTPTTGSF
ncbi:MAG: metallophosphoesterase, partial [Planctomycetota bacterium]